MQKLIKTTDHGIMKFKSIDAITSKVVSDALGVPHRDLLLNVGKAEKYQKEFNSQMSGDTLETKDFNPVFRDHTYISRGREYQCKIMNADGVKALIKVIDTQEAYNYFALLMGEFNILDSEREVREISKTDSLKYTDSIKALRARLVEVGTTQRESWFYSTIQRKLHKKATGRTLVRGGVDHDALTDYEEAVITLLRRLVPSWIKEGNTLNAKDTRKHLYSRIEGFNVISIERAS